MTFPRDVGIVLAALAFLASAPFTGQASGATDEPRIACTAPTFDFGKVGNAAQVVHVFLVANEGTAPLAISSVDSGCGCTVAKSSTNAIAPGNNTEVTAKFDTANRTGQQRKAIYVRSNDRQNPIFRLELTGDLFDVPKFNQPPAPAVPVAVVAGPGAVQTTPGRLDFGGINSDDRPEGQVTVSGEGTNEFKVLGVSSTCTNVSFRIEPLDGRRWRIVAKLLPPRPAGKGVAEMVIRTTHPAMSEVKIPLAWEALADVYAIPSEVSLVAGTTNAVCRYVAIRSHSGKPFRIERVELPEGMVTTPEPAPNGGYRCEIQGIVPSTNLNGRALVFHTDRPGEERVTVPIRVTAGAVGQRANRLESSDGK